MEPKGTEYPRKQTDKRPFVGQNTPDHVTPTTSGTVSRANQAQNNPVGLEEGCSHAPLECFAVIEGNNEPTMHHQDPSVKYWSGYVPQGRTPGGIRMGLVRNESPIAPNTWTATQIDFTFWLYRGPPRVFSAGF